jgi:glycosyltransferase involved in cell wall biosynthesis
LYRYNQDYPHHRMELILVDDASTDPAGLYKL